MSKFPWFTTMSDAYGDFTHIADINGRLYKITDCKNPNWHGRHALYAKHDDQWHIISIFSSGSTVEKVKEYAESDPAALWQRKEERIARKLCAAKGIDPDAIGHAVTDETRAKLGETYPLWKWQEVFNVKPMLAALEGVKS